MPKINSFQRVSVAVATTDGTQTTAATFDTSAWEDAAFMVQARICARETDDSDEIAGYLLAGAFKLDGGTLSLVGSVSQLFVAESTGGWDATLDANGDNIRVRVTGAAATDVKWLVDLDVQVNDDAPYTAS